MYEPTLFRMLLPEAQMKVLGKTSQKQKNKGQASKDGWDAYTSEITLFLKTEWMFFKKLKIALPYDPTPGHIYGKDGSSNLKRHRHSSVHGSRHCKQYSLFIIAKTWKHLNCPQTDEWIKKMWYTHTQTHRHTHTLEYYLAVK